MDPSRKSTSRNTSLISDENQPLRQQQQQQQSAGNNNDLYQLVQMQQNTINRLTQELTKKLQNVPRDLYEKTLNDLETEKYEHTKSKNMIAELKDEVEAKKSEVEYFKNELEKERCAYAKVLEYLKEKCLNESTKSFELMSKIAESEIKYKDAMKGMNQKESIFTELCEQVKQREIDYECKLDELNLKAEQERYIKSLINEKVSSGGGGGNGANKIKTRRK